MLPGNRDFVRIWNVIDGSWFYLAGMAGACKLGINWQDAEKQAELAGLYINKAVFRKIKHVEEYLIKKEGERNVNQ